MKTQLSATGLAFGFTMGGTSTSSKLLPIKGYDMLTQMKRGVMASLLLAMGSAGVVHAQAAALAQPTTTGSSFSTGGTGSSGFDASVPAGTGNINNVNTVTTTPQAAAADGSSPQSATDGATGAAAKADQDKKVAACNEAQNKAAANDSTASEADADKKCQAAQYNTPDPTGGATGRTGDATAAADQKGAAYAAEGDAHSAMFSPSMSTDGATPAKVDVLSENQVVRLDGQDIVNQANDNGDLGTLTNPDRIKNDAMPTTNWADGGKAVATQDLPWTAADQARYDPATAVIGGTGSGLVACSSCPGGKYGVDTNDGSFKTGMTEALQDKFTTIQMPGGEAGTLWNGYQVTSDSPAGATPAKLETASMLQAMGESKGMSQDQIDIAIADVNRESGLNTLPNPKTDQKTTSAFGLGQYTGDTWISSSKADNDGVVLNRNNTFDQASVMLDDVANRNNAYNSSASAQSSMSAGEYDYAIHHDGSVGAVKQSTINYYNSTAATGQAYADYAQAEVNGSGNGTSAVQLTPSSPYVASNGGLTTGGSNGSSGISSGGSVGSSGIQTGSSGIQTGGSTLASLLGLGGSSTGTGTGLGTGNSSLLSSIASAALVQQLLGSKSSSGSTGTTSSPATTTASTGSTTASTTPNGYDIAMEVAKLCGAGLDTTSDADMLKVSNCQQQTLSEIATK